MNDKVLNISKKTFISVIIMLSIVIIAAIALTYILPSGEFKIVLPDGTPDPNSYVLLENVKGINIFKGIFAPILVLFSDDGLTLIMLSIFLLVIAGAFQVMNDTNGIKVIVKRLIAKFKDKKRGLIAIVALLFMCFGSFFGLFEEVLTLLPIIAILTLSLGYDSYTGFIICIVATGFGFASAITNPFTVVIVSNRLDISVFSGVWLRILVFVVMYVLLLSYVFLHMRKIAKNPESSPTYENDQKRLANLESDEEIINSSRIFKTYVTFLLLVLATIITVTSIEAIRDYTVVFLIVVFLFGGIICGLITSQTKKEALKSFGSGVLSALPTILLVLMASSIKYILEQGYILHTIGYNISNAISGHSPIVVALLIYLIILVLEFFISSSTAKAIFVMGVLSCVTLNISNNTLVLAYLFADGYSNVIFPTSPVLLIGLSMIGMNYLSWVKQAKWLFLVNIIIVILFITFAVLIGY